MPLITSCMWPASAPVRVDPSAEMQCTGCPVSTPLFISCRMWNGREMRVPSVVRAAAAAFSTRSGDAAMLSTTAALTPLDTPAQTAALFVNLSLIQKYDHAQVHCLLLPDVCQPALD